MDFGEFKVAKILIGEDDGKIPIAFVDAVVAQGDARDAKDTQRNHGDAS